MSHLSFVALPQIKKKAPTSHLSADGMHRKHLQSYQRSSVCMATGDVTVVCSVQHRCRNSYCTFLINRCDDQSTVIRCWQLFRVPLLCFFADKWNKRKKLSPRGSGKLSASIIYFLILFQQLILSQLIDCVFLTCKTSCFIFFFKCKIYVFKDQNLCVCVKSLILAFHSW